jgi:hypothetical protein
VSTALDRLIEAGMATSYPPQQERSPLLCSCGCTEPHVIATRETFDGVQLSIWSDGSITHGRLGTYLRGLGECRSNYGRRARVRAVRLMADDFAVFTAAEIPTVIKIAEATFAHSYSSEVDRRNDARSKAHRVLARGPECPECGHAPCLRCEPCLARKPS